jgi:hypothetical protein
MGEGFIPPTVRPYTRWWTRGGETNQTFSGAWLPADASLFSRLLRVHVVISGSARLPSAWPWSIPAAAQQIELRARPR